MSGFNRQQTRPPRLTGGLAPTLVLSCVAISLAPAADEPRRDSPPAKTTLPAPVINDKILAYAREKVGQSVNDGECTGLVVEALKAAKARRYPPFGGEDDYVWGIPVTVRAQIRPGDIIQFRDAVFRGRVATTDEDGTATIHFYRTTFDHHSAIVDEVRDRGRSLVILHQNAGNDDASADERKLVRHDVLRMADQRPGEGKVWFYRPVPRAEGEPEPDFTQDAHAPDPPPEHSTQKFEPHSRAGQAKVSPP
jgi:hypothetical protein